MAYGEDDEDDIEDEDEEGGFTDETAGLALAHWIEDHLAGDPRFERVEVQSPGPLDGEEVRARLAVNKASHFFVSVLPDDAIVRVGLSTEDEEISNAIEQVIEEHGGSMTEFLQDAMETAEELEHEMVHFHDDSYYFASDIPYATEHQLRSRIFREEVLMYAEGYADALIEIVEDEG